MSEDCRFNILHLFYQLGFWFCYRKTSGVCSRSTASSFPCATEMEQTVFSRPTLHRMKWSTACSKFTRYIMYFVFYSLHCYHLNLHALDKFVHFCAFLLWWAILMMHICMFFAWLTDYSWDSGLCFKRVLSIWWMRSENKTNKLVLWLGGAASCVVSKIGIALTSWPPRIKSDSESLGSIFY